MHPDARSHAQDLADFVVASPTSYHAAAEIARRLEVAGYRRFDEREGFAAPGGRGYVLRHGAVIAWVAPGTLAPDAGLRIVGTHTDSPALKVKPDPALEVPGWHQVGVEVYGGPLLNSWLDRDLGIAGRVVTRDGAVHLVRSGAVARLPQLAIHLDRAANEGLNLERQAHLQPILGTGDAPGLLAHLAGLAGVDPSRIVGHDLYTFDTQPPQMIGIAGEFLASGRLDNLASTHAALTAAESPGESRDLLVFAAFDHEEVGSATTSGAAGPLLEDVILRLAAGYGLGVDETKALLARSSCVSADCGHLVHPNYPARHDPVARPLPNRGPLLKVNAQQRYATDSVGAAIWAAACERARVPSQVFVSHNDVPCGSTIGPITATRLGITTVDVGAGLLSMHSARELIGIDDAWYLARALAAYWE
ncbi:MAG TPA: M18 family aminopeptidase [Arachnia sp.]|nr:M18 family aminopeptidase [Arachnia sp.]HMT85334.1 M18 family aminopeptidase [Arachnia sp.]